MARIRKYSHHFTVTELDTFSRQVVDRFLLNNTQYGTRVVGWNKGRPVIERFPDKQYGTSDKAKTQYRFHINHYDEFRAFVDAETKGIHWDISEEPMYDPVACTFKVKPKWQPREHQIPLIKYIVDPLTNGEPNRSKAAVLQAGQGKEQPLDAKIKVPGGWKLMGEMKVGDVVTARDGTPANVTGVFPQGIKPVYRFTFADGRTTLAGKDHLWKIYRPNMAWSEDGKVVDTNEIIRVMDLSLARTKNKGYERIYIDLPESEICPDADLPIDPYLLGVLIGDGGLSGNSVIISTRDEFIIDKISKLIPDNLRVVHRSDYDYCISSGPSPLNRHGLLEDLRRLGLAGTKSVDKFIPLKYLNASHAQRVALLQGLLDTDGTTGANNAGGINFSTSSEALALDVQYLARSLGHMAKLSSRIPHYTHNGERRAGHLAYRVFIRTKSPKELFTLPRQLNKMEEENQYSKTLKLRILKVELAGYEECQCISIDHPEHLYVTDDFIVTHNTFSALQSTAQIGARTMLVIKGGYIKQWVNAIKDTFEDITKGDVLAINGTGNLISLMQMAKDNTLKAKFIIISNRTFQIYLQDYIENGHAHGMYPIAAPDFFKEMGIGLRINDEVHMHFHLNFTQDLFTHCPMILGLSATLTPDDPFMERMYKTMFPPEQRYQGAVFQRYAYATSLHYRLKEPRFARYKSRGMGSYNHIEYEKWLMKNKDSFQRYLDIIANVIDYEYASRRKAGERIIVFAGTVDFCTRLTKMYSEKYPDLKVLRYCESDPFDNVLSGDIIFSTLISAGTAIDIPGLIRVFMTTAVGSSQQNEQAFGRLRKIDTDNDLNFIWLTCDDIPQHVKYDQRKKKLLSDKALAIHSYNLNVKV